MRKRILPRALLAAILLALPAAADAPRNPPQYDRFDADSVTISDAFTGLLWDRKSVIRGVTFDLADCSFVTSLPLGRLPTVKELLTLVDEDPHLEYEAGANVMKMIDQPAFDKTPVDLPYWTSTPAPGGMFWPVSFATGVAAPRDKTLKGNARCVQ